MKLTEKEILTEWEKWMLDTDCESDREWLTESMTEILIVNKRLTLRDWLRKKENNSERETHWKDNWNRGGEI